MYSSVQKSIFMFTAGEHVVYLFVGPPTLNLSSTIESNIERLKTLHNNYLSGHLLKNY